jgi:hypothetical protein
MDYGRRERSERGVIGLQRHTNLLEMVLALCSPRCLPRRLYRRQQER